MDFPVWIAFFITTLVVALSPGPGAVLAMSVGLRYGYRHALAAIAGLQTALLMQLGLVAAGLGALLATSAGAFAVLKLAGALYLVWLGIQKWRAPSHVEKDDPALPHLLVSSFYRTGVLVNLSNPKAIVFIAALVPQFVDPARAQVPQFGLIAATLCITDVVVMSGYALLAGRFRGRASRPGALLWQNRIFGGLFVCAGLILAGSARH